MTDATLLRRLGEPEEVAAAGVVPGVRSGRLYHRRDHRRLRRHGAGRLIWRARARISRRHRSILRSRASGGLRQLEPGHDGRRRCAAIGMRPSAAATEPVTCERVSAGGVDGEWISPANAPEDKAILYFHGGGFRLGSVASHRDLIAQIARSERLPRARDQLPPRAGTSFSGRAGGCAGRLWLDARSGLEAGQHRLCRGFRRRQSRARRHAGPARTRASAAGGGGADVAMDRSGGDRRELRHPRRRGSDPSASDDPGAGQELSGRAGRSARSAGIAAVCRSLRACRRY